ncbi:MAG: hypothetical protein JXR83_11880 [Deltaproteobacteria bacterium]|nr:hypothetical protein [Deltaproteobacteria bacterium]
MSLRGHPSVLIVSLIVAASVQPGRGSAQCQVGAPQALLPIDGRRVTCPPDFSWAAGANNDTLYLNVSTSPDLDRVIDVINWADDGTHTYSGELARFLPRIGETLYWRVVADGCNPVQRASSPVQSLVVGEVSVDPHYFVVNIGWPGGSYSEYGWDPFDAATIQTADLLDLIDNKVQTRGLHPNKKLAFGFVIPYTFVADAASFVPILQRLLAVAEEADLPVLIGLDGFEWWRGRPDLWNYWDSAGPGYNPANRANVEWTSWSQSDAVQFGWRNWGSPFKLSEPHPNLTSPAVIAANQQALQTLGAVIREWHLGLAAEKKYLFAGIRLGWETSIGINYFYPVDEAVCTSGSANCNPFSNARQVGYAAVATAGLGSSGALTAQQLTAALQIHMDAQARALVEIGIPRRKIFLHIGADDNPAAHPSLLFAGTDAALTPYAHPGFSFYTGASGPDGMAGLESTLGQTAETAWAVSEWGGPGGAAWADAIRQFTQRHHNKLINAFVVVDHAAVRQTLDEVVCWVQPPLLQATVSGRRATLAWSAPSRAQQLYLNVTRDPTLSVAGGFAVVDVANSVVTAVNQTVLEDLADGTYYCKLFADGCNRRAVSDLVVFTVQATIADAGCTTCGDGGTGADGGSSRDAGSIGDRGSNRDARENGDGSAAESGLQPGPPDRGANCSGGCACAAGRDLTTGSAAGAIGLAALVVAGLSVRRPKPRPGRGERRAASGQ